AQALKIIQHRGQWLDVRLPSEFQNLAIEGSINIPLYFVRLKLNALDRKMPYVVVCDTGRRSSAAAFILSERGFDAYVLKGGRSASRLPMRRPGWRAIAQALRCAAFPDGSRTVPACAAYESRPRPACLT